MVRGSVPEIEQLLEIALDASTVLRRRSGGPWEGVTQTRHPQGCVVAATDEITGSSPLSVGERDTPGVC